MANNGENRTGERRITLAFYLMERRASLSHIRALPVYSELFQDKSFETFRDIVEKDIRVLRSSGYRVEQAMNQLGEYTYWINNSAGIKVDAKDADLSVLYGVLGHKGRNDAEQFVQMGVHKLLADVPSSEYAHTFRTNVPRGDYIVDIANALQNEQLIEFRYQSGAKNTEALYVVRPHRIHVHFDSFYFSGWEVSVNGVDTGARRIYKVSRIIAAPKFLKKNAHNLVQISAPGSLTAGFATASASTNDPSINGSSTNDSSTDESAKKRRESSDANSDSDAFAPVEATIRVRTGTCTPLVAMANSMEEISSDFQRAIFIGIDKHELFDYLIFYGTDAYLESPKELRQEFIVRLSHIMALCDREWES
ncbi:putative DNA-binding transcriptional regulator YafY [Arcanobacterium pluranimalium]|uniref:WYL domain-containing protein n=1 Tax=Arcanobacterium pluranimalium TaxID=108028 RepID=UPI00195D2E26|nr:WYL domain-containing protein [Arcanobacterium pluranimalium]MBM7825422.1 putative DNA-binding transcriptional regulator YafY [Arcanobacterium pluranimalium]